MVYSLAYLSWLLADYSKCIFKDLSGFTICIFRFSQFHLSTVLSFTYSYLEQKWSVCQCDSSLSNVCIRHNEWNILLVNSFWNTQSRILFQSCILFHENKTKQFFEIHQIFPYHLNSKYKILFSAANRAYYRIQVYADISKNIFSVPEFRQRVTDFRIHTSNYIIENIFFNTDIIFYNCFHLSP